MSEILQFSSRNCLVWFTEKPFCDRDRKSPTFSYLGHEWYFLLSVNTYGSYYYLSVYPVDEKKILHRKFQLDAFIHSVSYDTWVKHLGTLILLPNDIRIKNIGINITDDGCNGDWHVCIIFSGDLPGELQIKETEANNLTSNLTDPSSIVKKAKLAASAADDSLSDEEILCTDFGKLLEQQSSSDVTMTCGDRKFSAHRLILAARSEVFAAMFQNKMIESETGNIDIKDIDGEVFELLLKYVYTGKISDLSVDIVSSLYIAADKYSIHSLKNKCSKWMLGSLTEENCLDFLVISDTLNDDMLKGRLINFVAEILNILEGDDWQKFSDNHPKLAMSVYQRRVFMKPV